MCQMILAAVILLTAGMSSVTTEESSGSQQQQQYPQKTVLAFGGNGFIGSHVITRMIERNYKVIICSRGNWYFDSEVRIKPHVTQVICDRENSDIEYCTDLVKVLNDTEYFDYVLDFSAYKPEVIADVIEHLEGKTGVYVYISSDSVYEVCERPEVLTPSKETDAVRPTEEEDQDRLNELDSYGHEKLAGEEVLVDNRERGGMKYLVFRLPDVVGPRDTTDRWWTYQMWIQFYDAIKIPLYIPPEVANLRTSFVFVKDVASAILLALDKGSEVWNDVYNLGFDRDFTLKEFLDDLSKELSVKVDYNYEASSRAFNLFPSVTRGPVDISKAKQVLGFQPTAWKDAMKETVEFYKEAFHSYPSERDDVAHQITRYVLPREMKGKFLQMIDRLDSSLHTTKQEL